MDKIILVDGTSIEFTSLMINGDKLAITIIGKTINDVEPLMTSSNLAKLQIANSSDSVYGVYNNQICDSLTLNLSDSSLTINLSKLDDTQVQLNELQETVNKLMANSNTATTTGA